MARRPITIVPPAPKRKTIPKNPEKPGASPRFICNTSTLAVLERHIENGLHPDQAASLAGVSYRTFERWRQYGRMGHPDYQELEDRIAKAEAKHTQKLLDRITEVALDKTADGDVKLAKDILFRRNRRWNERTVHSFEGNEDVQRLWDCIRQEIGNEATIERIVRRFFEKDHERVVGASDSRHPPTGDGASG